MRRLFACALVLFWVACDSPSESDAGIDSGVDAGPPVEEDAGAVPYWPGELPSTDALGTRRGRSIMRSIVHLHSPLSHDACDGTGWVDGELADPECLQHFRDSMCALRLDAVMLTDHAPHVNEVDFEGALWLRDEDEAVLDGDSNLVAARMACENGHRVLLTVGSENTLMPILLETHPADPSDPDALEDVYDPDSPESIAAFQAAGALIWQAHTEGRTLDQLRTTQLDGLELYNLHANVDPGIREDELGLEPISYLADLLDFTRPQLRLPPDLAAMAFLEENRVALDRWDTLLAEGFTMAGSGGCDAHENALPMLLSDGERADSYRRMMYWIQNHLLVDTRDRAGVRDALASGRFYVTTELFGSPMGFDYTAEQDSTTFEMGETAPVGATLRIARPALPDTVPQEPAPTITMRLLRAAAGGGVEVASGSDATLEHVTTEAGAYRVEVHIVPEHTRSVLGNRADILIKDFVWVYSNPIYVAD